MKMLIHRNASGTPSGRRDKRLVLQWVVALFVVWFSAAASFAQSRLAGEVTDQATGEPIIGATVSLQDTPVGASTNAAGKFNLTIPAQYKEGVLLVAFMGYVTQEIRWSATMTQLDVALVSGTIDMDEIVVVGYGAQPRSDITGAVASVSKDRLEKMPATDAVQLLQGAVAGLNLMSQSAGSNPDGQTVMLVRGRNSIAGDNDPLIVVDGMPFYGGLSEIAPHDIQNIEVLKDASATAIYGSRASNGVFLITTKKGARGATKITYDGYFSMQDVSNFPDLMNPEQYWSYRLLRSNNDNYDEDDETTWPLSDSEREVYKDGSYKDWTWRDLILRTGKSQRHSVSISGGSDRTTFNVSAYVVNTEGIVEGDSYSKYNTRARINTTIKPWLTYDTSTSLTYVDNSGATPNFVDVFNKSPLMRPFNPDGSVNIYPDASDPKKANPLENHLYDDRNRTYGASTSHNFNVSMPWVEGLSYKLSFSGQYSGSEKYRYMPRTTQKGGEKNGIATTSDGMRYSLLMENLVTYQRKIEKHSIFLTGLYGWEEKVNRIIRTEASNYPDDVLSWYNAQPGMLSRTIEEPKEVILSGMFRANYAYDSRYLFTFTVRRDGYSGFGANTKWGTFASVALGWNVHNEKFFEPVKDVLSTFKLRFSFGENGNMGIKPYSTIQQMKAGGYVANGQTAAGYIPSSVGNANLSWEPTRSLNIGFDYGFLNNRISGDFNIYRNDTRDLLLKRSISLVTGMASITDNIGKTRNEGIEFTINSVNMNRKDFSWSTSFNFAINRNEIRDLYGDGEDDISNGWFLGKPIKVNYDYLHTGVWQQNEANLAALYGAQPGYAKYDDRNNDGTYNMDDRQIIGTSEPWFTSSMTNTFNYKGFSLSILLYGVTGVKKPNPYKDNNYLINRNWWTASNPTNSFWGVGTDANAYANGKSDKPSVYESADYIRVKDITLSYTLPKKLLQTININSARVYISAKNPFTFTSWAGLDPELDTQRAIPLQRELIFGATFSF